MLKNILNLKGAQELSKNDQKSINGGGKCSDNCVGRPTGALCYYQDHCGCPGDCISEICVPW